MAAMALASSGVKAKHNLVEGVGVDSRPDTHWQLVTVLVGQREGQPQSSGLCQGIGEVGGQGQIVLQLVNIDSYNVPASPGAAWHGRAPASKSGRRSGAKEPRALAADNAFC